MRHEKAQNLFQLALEMQASRQGVSLADIEERFGVGRRTAMRMRDAVASVFPQVEEIAGDDRAKRWRILKSTVNGLIDVSVEELAALESGVRLMQQQNRAVEAAELTGLMAKLKAMMRPDAVRRVAPDLDALLESEGLAMRPGPRPRISMGVVTILSCARRSNPAARSVSATATGRPVRRTNGSFTPMASCMATGII
ncbi:hypothetical protein [Azospirillum argentinense]|uniref:hypothetical protein n=1 Tax=Azospirillum argentinense TaxID=2970906 RepID=UPI0032DF6361